MEHRRGREQSYSELGPQFETAVARRERFADNYDIDFGADRVFPELVEAMLAEIPAASSVLEIGAATGLLTKPLLEHARCVTAMEPSEGMLRRLLSTDVATSPGLTVLKGIAEDLPEEIAHDVAVVTFTPRRGYALVRLLHELALRVSDRIVVLLTVDGSLEWAQLARTSVTRGFETWMHLLPRGGGKAPGVVLTVSLAAGRGLAEMQAGGEAPWTVDARDVVVPHPAPRGTATRLVRYLLSGGDTALNLETDARDVERLYGSLRTAVHRLARDEVTVRRLGDVIQLVRLPKAGEGAAEDMPFEE